MSTDPRRLDASPRVALRVVQPVPAQAVLDCRLTLERARERGDDWYVWVERRHYGTNAHDMLREDGSPAACPVVGCEAVRARRA